MCAGLWCMVCVCMDGVGTCVWYMWRGHVCVERIDVKNNSTAAISIQICERKYGWEKNAIHCLSPQKIVKVPLHSSWADTLQRQLDLLEEGDTVCVTKVPIRVDVLSSKMLNILSYSRQTLLIHRVPAVTSHLRWYLPKSSFRIKLQLWGVTHLYLRTCFYFGG